MLTQLLIGSLVVSLTVIVQAAFIGAAHSVSARPDSWLAQRPSTFRTIITLIAVTLWLMTAHSIGVWLWAATFLHLEVFESLEPALYFSVVSFTTLGFGDVLLPDEWRLLSGISAANGLLIFGVSTAFLVEFLTGLREVRTKAR